MIFRWCSLAIRASLFSCALALTVTVVPLAGGAQFVPPVIRERDDARNETGRTASELFQDLRWLAISLDENVSPYVDVTSSDSIDRIITQHACRWLDILRAHPASVRHLDQALRIGLLAGDENFAKQQLTERLAAPASTLGEHASAYMVAVRAFADQTHPNRVQIAEQYMSQLDALGTTNETIFWKFLAHMHLVQTYAMLDQQNSALLHLRLAMDQLPEIPFEFRGEALGEITSRPLVWELMFGQPHGRARVDALRQQLMAATEAPQSLRTINPSVVNRTIDYQADIARAIHDFGMIGQVAPQIVGTHWINVAGHRLSTVDTGGSPHLQVLSPDTGKVQIVVLGVGQSEETFSALLFVQRLQLALATRGMKITIVGALAFRGYWGDIAIPLDTEFIRLKPFLCDSLRLTIPLAFVAQSKARSLDGGLQIPSDPNFMAYHFPQGALWVWIVDQRGYIRKIYGGMELSHAIQRDMTHYVTTLALHPGPSVQ